MSREDAGRIGHASLRPGGVSALRLLLCSSEPRDSACSILRLIAPLQRDPGIQIRWFDEAPSKELLQWADAVLVQRNFPTSSLRKRWFLRAVYASGLPLFYETDDNFLDVHPTHPDHGKFEKERHHLLRVLRKCDAMIVSTEELAKKYGEGKPCVVAPNLLEEDMWPQVAIEPDPGRVCIGFAGSPTHMEDLVLCEEALERIAAKYRERVRFLFLGCSTPRLEALPNADVRPFVTSYSEYAQNLGGAGIHIGLAPLQNTYFNRAKSAIKWMEMSACGIAGVYSDLEPYSKVVVHGRNGFLVGDSAEAWYQALERLIEDNDLRSSIARAAQSDLYASHTLGSQAGELPQSIRSLVAQIPVRQGVRDRLHRWLCMWWR